MNAIKERQKKICHLLKQDGFDKVILGDPMSIYYLTVLSSMFQHESNLA